VRRAEIRKGKAKDNPFLCVLSELCGENLILTIAHHVYLIMAPLVNGWYGAENKTRPSAAFAHQYSIALSDP